MVAITSADAQNRFGELLERAQREPVAVTRHGRTVAYVVSAADMDDLAALRERRSAAARWYAEYRGQFCSDNTELTDADVNELVHELR